MYYVSGVIFHGQIVKKQNYLILTIDLCKISSNYFSKSLAKSIFKTNSYRKLLYKAEIFIELRN